MAEFVFTDANFVVGSSGAGVDLSDHVTSVTVTYSAEVLDKTAMGSSARGRLSGLKDGNFSVEFNQDLAASEVEATLWPLIGADSTTVWVAVKHHSSACNSLNPKYYGKTVLESLPLGGGVGDLAKTSVTFQCDGLINRSVTAT